MFTTPLATSTRRRADLWRVAVLMAGALAVAAPARPALGPPGRHVADDIQRSYPAELLPESSTPGPPHPEIANDSHTWNAVLSVAVDTAGRVEPGSVRVLDADDSATARAARAAVPGLRYRPARVVSAPGPCAIYNRTLVTCTGPRPFVRPVRSREVLQISILPQGDRGE